MKETKLQAFELAMVTITLLITFSPTKSCVRYLDPQLHVGDNYLFLKKVFMYQLQTRNICKQSKSGIENLLIPLIKKYMYKSGTKLCFDKWGRQSPT